jgi:hypothetical protein
MVQQASRPRSSMTVSWLAMPSPTTAAACRSRARISSVRLAGISRYAMVSRIADGAEYIRPPRRGASVQAKRSTRGVLRSGRARPLTPAFLGRRASVDLA